MYPRLRCAACAWLEPEHTAEGRDADPADSPDLPAGTEALFGRSLARRHPSSPVMAELLAASSLDGLKYIAELDDEAVCDTMVSTVFEVLLRKAEAGQPAVGEPPLLSIP